MTLVHWFYIYLIILFGFMMLMLDRMNEQMTSELKLIREEITVVSMQIDSIGMFLGDKEIKGE